MHAAARQFLEEHAHLATIGKAVNFGGCNVNGDVHDIWSDHQWTIVDNNPNPALYLTDKHKYYQENAARWHPDGAYELAICTEVFEHTKEWPSICHTAYMSLKPGALFLITAGGYQRPQHSMYDGGPLRENEYYENVGAHELGIVLTGVGFRSRIIYNPQDKDVYAVAIRL